MVLEFILLFKGGIADVVVEVLVLVVVLVLVAVQI